MKTPVPPPVEKLFRLTVRVPRLINVMDPIPGAKDPLHTVPDEWLLGEVPAFSAMMARDGYWKNCPHYKPSLLSQNGSPVGNKLRMKLKDIIVREVPSEQANW